MTKDNADIEYDPEFPFIVRLIDGEVISKHTTTSGANSYLEYVMQGYGEVIDTTPKPKIPEGAEFIAWYDPSDNGEERIARRYGHPANKVWRIGWDTIEESELMSYIGDAEVTVLVRKDET